MKKLLRDCAGALRGGLSSLLAPAADPRVAFTSAEQRQRDLLALAQRALGELAATRDQLAARVPALQAQLPRLETEALRALGVGRDDLARLALRRRRLAAGELQAIERQVGEIEEQEQQLALHEQRLAAQVEAFEARVQVVAASYSAAETQLRMNQTLGSVSAGLNDLGLALEQAEQQAARIQGRATALEALIGGASEGADGPAGEEALIEAEIAALKLRLGRAGAADE